MRTPNYGALPPSHDAPCPKTERHAMKVLVLHHIEPEYQSFLMNAAGSKPSTSAISRNFTTSILRVPSSHFET